MSHINDFLSPHITKPFQIVEGNQSTKIYSNMYYYIPLKIYDFQEIPAIGDGFFPHFVRRNNAAMSACVMKNKPWSNLGAGKLANLSPIFEVLYLHFLHTNFTLKYKEFGNL